MGRFANQVKRNRHMVNAHGDFGEARFGNGTELIFLVFLKIRQLIFAESSSLRVLV
jgi:hypothetical protein